MINLFFFVYFHAMKYSLEVPAIHMKSPMKYPRFKNENPLKMLGNRYEIDNEIPKVQE